MSERDKLRGVLSNVICNVSNFPESAQPGLWGRDMSVVINKTADAILDSNWLAEHDERAETLYEQREWPERLAEHDRLVAEKAWNEGHESGIDDAYSDGGPMAAYTDNPYRRAPEEDT